MTLIRKPNEIQVQTKIKALVYGQSGTGKTTLALSAPKPLLLDFDGGASRLNTEHRVDTVQIKTWAEVNQVLSEDLAAYETIVVDTVGKMLDCIITSVCAGRIPRIQDWGSINNTFSTFCRTLSGLNKNIIFVAHRDNRKEGDNNVFVPAIREKSYNSIVTELDLVGYIESREGKRVITFDFSDRNDGKNTCNLPQFMGVPSIVDNTGKVTGKNVFFTTQIIQPFVARLKAQAEMVENYTALTEEIDEDVACITDDASANDFMARVMVGKKYPHIGASKQFAKTKFLAKVTELELSYNKTTKQRDAPPTKPNHQAKNASMPQKQKKQTNQSQTTKMNQIRARECVSSTRAPPHNRGGGGGGATGSATATEAPQPRVRLRAVRRTGGGRVAVYLGRRPRRRFSGCSGPRTRCLRSAAWGWCSCGSSSGSRSIERYILRLLA